MQRGMLGGGTLQHGRQHMEMGSTPHSNQRHHGYGENLGIPNGGAFRIPYGQALGIPYGGTLGIPATALAARGFLLVFASHS